MKKKKLALIGTLLATAATGSLVGTQFPAITVMADEKPSNVIMDTSETSESIDQTDSDLIYNTDSITEDETVISSEDESETAHADASETENTTDTQIVSDEQEKPSVTEEETADDGQEDAVSIDDKFQNEDKKVVSISNKDAKVVVLPAVEREGYKFLYWNTQNDGSGTTYYAGDKFTIGSEDDLYAIWEEDGTTFHVEPDGDNIIVENAQEK